MENNNQSYEIYAVGTWLIRPGHEKDFIIEWTNFAQWTNKNIQGAGKGYLLQDQLNPLRFISFGSWQNEAAIQKWREHKEFRGFISKVMPHCENFQPNTLKVVSASE